MNRRLLLANICWLCVGCNALTQRTFSGQVLDEGMHPVAGATVQLQAQGTHFSTDAQGNYQAHLPSSGDGPWVVKAAATGYAPQYVAVGSAKSFLTFVLRRADAVQTVDVSQTSAQVIANHGGLQTTLSWAPGALSLNGTPVTQGNVTVTMTFFNALDDATVFPGVMQATRDGGSAYALQTYGMADIEIASNGNLLQVTPGQALTWTVNIPASQKQFLQTLSAGDNQQPALYYLNPNTAVWNYVAGQDTASLAYDANQSTFTAQLPHLSTWNVDGVVGSNIPACVQGQVFDTSNNPCPNPQVYLWIMGVEEVARYNTNEDTTPIKTDSTGHYCIDIGGTRFRDAYATTNTAAYMVSMDGAGLDSDMCDPMNDYCRSQVLVGTASNNTWPSWNNMCRWQCTYNASAVGLACPYAAQAGLTTCPLSTVPPAQCTGQCSPNQFTVTLGSSCATGGCAQLADLHVTSCTDPNAGSTAGTGCPAGQSKDSTGKCCATANLRGGVCCNPLLAEGDYCTAATASCCPTAAPLCNDNLCVPSVDP